MDHLISRPPLQVHLTYGKERYVVKKPPAGVNLPLPQNKKLKKQTKKKRKKKKRNLQLNELYTGPPIPRWWEDKLLKPFWEAMW